LAVGTSRPLALARPNHWTSTELAVGLAQWSAQARGGSGSNPNLLALVTTGSLLSIIPIVAAVVILQRYWQSGLSAGSIKG